MIAAPAAPRAAADRSPAPVVPRRALIVTNQLPGHDIGMQHSGHVQYLGGFIDHLRAGGYAVTLAVLRPQVDFVALPSAALPFRVLSPHLRSSGGRLTQRSPKGTLRALAWKIYARLPQRLQAAADGVRVSLRKRRGFVHALGTFVTPEEIAYVREVVAAEAPSLVLYDGIFNACGPLDAAQTWIITHEVKHQRAASFRAQGVDVHAGGLTEAAEAALLARTGNAIAIQWDDAEELRRLAPAARVVVVPVAIDVAAVPAPAEAIPGRCLFVGSGSFHNYDGIRWFLDHCWAEIRAAVPRATLSIAGTVCGRLGDVPEGVVLHGVVADLAAVYREAALGLVPLRIGSGLKVKLIEALAYGAPVVTTTVGAQGLLGFAPRPFVVADEAPAFVSACIDMLRDDVARAELSAAARAGAERFRPQAAFAEFAAAVAESASR